MKNTALNTVTACYLSYLPKVALIAIALALVFPSFSQDSLREISSTDIRMFFPKKPKVYLTKVYQKPTEKYLRLKMDYGQHFIRNKTDWIAFEGRDKRPRVVDVVMTLHPSNEQDWTIDYADLIHGRIQALYELDSAFMLDQTIQWNLILQDQDRSYARAKNRLHGVVIRYDSLSSDKQKEKYSDLLERCNLRINKQKEGKKLIKVVERNKDKWKKMLIITDCTGSMLPYGTEVLLWHMLKTNKQNINQFSFFNDGDIEDKTIGSGKGVHVIDVKDYRKIPGIINHIMNIGVHNSDFAENDIEAILTSMEKSYDYKEVILIADNKSPIRDLELIKDINRPVRIVLCGVKKTIHPHYKRLAYETKGSIHTVENDIYEFMKNKEGKIIGVLKQLKKIQS